MAGGRITGVAMKEMAEVEWRSLRLMQSRESEVTLVLHNGTLLTSLGTSLISSFHLLTYPALLSIGFVW